MEIRAKHKNARMSPRKVRLIRGAIRGLPVTDADAQLTFLSGKAAVLVQKVLRSAVANARANHDLEPDVLQVEDVIVDGGLVMKRHNPVSRGMAHPILKRSSHITVVVSEKAGVKVKKVQRKAKKTEIDTLSADELLDYQEKTPDEPVTETPSEKGAGVAARPKSHQEEAYNIKKTHQQGGDRAKSHRRKSLSEG